MLLFIDAETTGKPKRFNAPVTELANWPRVVQLGWLRCNANGEETDSGESIVKPEGFRIPTEASRIHGITTERALREGLDLRVVLAGFAEVIRASRTLVAHNISFDANVLGAEFLRAGMANPLGPMPQVCTMHASTNHCKLRGPYGWKWPTLVELYRVLFGRVLTETHTALADVRACAECYFELKRLKVVR